MIIRAEMTNGARKAAAQAIGDHKGTFVAIGGLNV